MSTSTDDDHHVLLRPLEGHEDCQSDYINASYVNVRANYFHCTFSIILLWYNYCLLRATPSRPSFLPHKVSAFLPFSATHQL